MNKGFTIIFRCHSKLVTHTLQEETWITSTAEDAVRHLTNYYTNLCHWETVEILSIVDNNIDQVVELTKGVNHD